MPVGGGLIVGLASSVALSRWVKSLLFGSPQGDIGALAGAALLALIGAGAATLGPALAASRIQPAQSLRHD